MSDIEDTPVAIGEEETAINVMEGYCEDDDISDSLQKDELEENSSGSNTDPEPSRRTRKRFILASHIKIVEGAVPCYFCTICKNYFSFRSTARNHEFCGTNKKPFKCKLCGKGFLKKRDRDNHLRVHTGECPYTCATCNKSFQLKHKLTRHMRTHTREKGDYVCSTCPQRFFNEQARKKHEVSRHNLSKILHCSDCENSFETIEDKEDHDCCKSPKAKRLICETCGKGFNKSYNLKMHRRIHFKDRPFKCLQCNKCFRMKHHLVRHELNHESETEYECSKCPETFGRKDNLIRHLRLYHTDESGTSENKDTNMSESTSKPDEPKTASREKASTSGVSDQPPDSEQNKFGKSSRDNQKKGRPSHELLSLKSDLNKVHEIPKSRVRRRNVQSVKSNPTEGKSIGAMDNDSDNSGTSESHSVNDEAKKAPTIVVLTDLPNIRFAKTFRHVSTEISNSSMTVDVATTTLNQEHQTATVIHQKPVGASDVLQSTTTTARGANFEHSMKTMLSQRSNSDNSILYHSSTPGDKVDSPTSSKMKLGQIGTSIPCLPSTSEMSTSTSSVPKVSHATNTPPSDFSPSKSLPASIEQLSISSKQPDSSTIYSSNNTVSSTPPDIDNVIDISYDSNPREGSPKIPPRRMCVTLRRSNRLKNKLNSKKPSKSKEVKSLKKRSISDTVANKSGPSAKASTSAIAVTSNPYKNLLPSESVYSLSKRSISDSTIMYCMHTSVETSSLSVNHGSLSSEPLISSHKSPSVQSQSISRTSGSLINNSTFTISLESMLQSNEKFILTRRCASDGAIPTQRTEGYTLNTSSEIDLTASDNLMSLEGTSPKSSTVVQPPPSYAVCIATSSQSFTSTLTSSSTNIMRSASDSAIPTQPRSTKGNTLNTSSEIDLTESDNLMSLECTAPKTSAVAIPTHSPSSYAVCIATSSQSCTSTLTSSSANIMRSASDSAIPTQPTSTEGTLNTSSVIDLRLSENPMSLECTASKACTVVQPPSSDAVCIATSSRSCTSTLTSSSTNILRSASDSAIPTQPPSTEGNTFNTSSEIDLRSENPMNLKCTAPKTSTVVPPPGYSICIVNSSQRFTSTSSSSNISNSISSQNIPLTPTTSTDSIRRSSSDSAIVNRPSSEANRTVFNDPLAIARQLVAVPLDLSKPSGSGVPNPSDSTATNLVLPSPRVQEAVNLSTHSTINNSTSHLPTCAIIIINATNVPNLVTHVQARPLQPRMVDRSTDTPNWTTPTSTLTSPSKSLFRSIEQLSISSHSESSIAHRPTNSQQPSLESTGTSNPVSIAELRASTAALSIDSVQNRFYAKCSVVQTLTRDPQSAESMSVVQRSTSDNSIFKQPSTATAQSSITTRSPKGSWKMRFSKQDRI